MDRDSAYEQYFGSGANLADLMAEESRSAEERGALGEPSRFGTLAGRVFLLLTCEELTTMTVPAPGGLRPLRSAAVGNHGAGGQRRHGRGDAIASSLATRYLAEGRVELGQLMLVTLGRMAGNEPAAAGPGPAGGRGRRPGRRADRLRDGGSDPLVALLTDVPPDELSRRRGRVARALADFDAATIATTHEFCLQMLDGLGVLGDREPQAVFVEQVTDLTQEVATDLYLRRYATWDSPPMTYPEAVEIAQRAVAAGHARLVPAADNGESGDHAGAVEQVAYAEAAQAEVAVRMLSGRLFTYDDMLTRLRDAWPTPSAAPRRRPRLETCRGGDGRRVPGRRPGAVGHPAPSLRRHQHGDPDRRPQAGDLRLPRRRRLQLSRRGRRLEGQVQTLSTNWRSDAARARRPGPADGRRRVGRARIVVHPVQADTDRRLSSTDAPETAVPLQFGSSRTHRTPTGCPACRCSGRGSPPTWSPTSRPPWPRTGSWSSAVSASAGPRTSPSWSDQYPGRGHPRRPRRGRGAGGDAPDPGRFAIAGRGLADPARRPGAAPAGAPFARPR